MEQLVETFILPINITMHEDSPTENLDSSMYNEQSLVSTCDVVCVGNGIFFYFNKDGKLDLYILVKKKTPCSEKKSVLFIECTEMNWKTSDVNFLCLSVLLDMMGWFQGGIGKSHNDECLIYIFIGNVENGTPIILNRTIY